jgi:hypothetical protein
MQRRRLNEATFVFAVPLYYGLMILRGDHGGTMPPAARNFVGALVLIGGLCVGGVVQMGWYSMLSVKRYLAKGQLRNTQG